MTSAAESRTPRPEPSDVRWWITLAYCAFMFSIPFEYPHRTIPAEVHTVTAAVFLLVATTQPGIWFRVAPAAFWWLAAYVWAYVAMMLFVEHVAEAQRLLVNYVLVALLFWVGSTLMSRERVARAALSSFVLGCVVISVLTMLATSTGTLRGRSMVLGQDANLLGGNMALSLVIVMVLTFGTTFRLWTIRTLAACGVAALLAKALMASSSRGAMIATAGGVVAFAVAGGNARTWRRNMAIGVLVVAALLAAVYRSDSMWRRYRVTVVERNLSGREALYPEAWQMFLEKPVLGWGPIDNMYELGLRTASLGMGKKNVDGLSIYENRDAHNLLLDVLTSVGIVGAIPLLVCLALCVRGACKARTGPRGAGPLALVTVVLLLSMDTNWSASKQGWTVLAYAAISGSLAGSRRTASVSHRRSPVPALA